MRDPTDHLVEHMLNNVHYRGSPKHKRHPHLFGLQPFNGRRGDATLCDDADFDPDRIFEARETNHATSEFHGYPVLQTEAIARAVFNRFSAWAEEQGTETEQSASDSCRFRYRLR